MSEEIQPSLSLVPIGHVRTSKRFKFDAPSQPDESKDEVNLIELLPGKQFELALSDLETFDRIWLLWWFDRNSTWRPRVLPPRGPAKRRGVFATRSPHRPNPLGLTCVSLLSINGRFLEVGPLDLVDGTPIFDIKPYLRTVDAHPESSLGWIETVVAEENDPGAYQVRVSDTASEQLAWLRATWNIDFTERAFGILGRDPSPHRTRRILQIEPNLFRIACGAWRMYFQVHDDYVLVTDIDKGYKDEGLDVTYLKDIIDGEAQVAFAQWKSLQKPTTS